jgi:hypothetical protein
VSQPPHLSDDQLWVGDTSTEEHLSGCEVCRARLRDLGAEQDRVAGWLRSSASVVAADGPMPSTVAARLDDLVHREADRRASAAATRVTPLPAARRRTSWRPWLVAAAVAGVAVVGGGVLLQTSTGPDVVAGTSAESATERLEGESSSGGSLGGTDGAAGDAVAAALPPVPDAVLDEAQRSGGDDTLRSCGAVLAEQVGGSVVAAAQVTAHSRGGVVLTVDIADERAVWWLPDCDAPVELAWGRSPAG